MTTQNNLNDIQDVLRVLDLMILNYEEIIGYRVTKGYENDKFYYTLAGLDKARLLITSQTFLASQEEYLKNKGNKSIF